MPTVPLACLKQLFYNARTYTNWKKKAVDTKLLQELYDLVKLGPTSANCLPLRIVFIQSTHAKKRLKPHLLPGNVDKTMQAPVTAILAYDLHFHENLPRLFPYVDAKSWFDDKPDFIQETAFRNGTLQGGYFILAARALGLDCGPMSGFNNESLDKEFFPKGKCKSNFLCNLGYGDSSALPERSPRLTFDETCKLL